MVSQEILRNKSVVCLNVPIYEGILTVVQIDHIYGVRNDNRLINLRECRHRENCYNQELTSKNTSECKGVSRDDKNKKWLVAAR
jgi:hypothetical protein